MSRHDPITPAQLDLIRALAAQLDIQLGLVKAEAEEAFGSELDRLKRGEASTLIEWLQLIRDGHAPRPVPPGQLAMFGGERLR